MQGVKGRVNTSLINSPVPSSNPSYTGFCKEGMNKVVSDRIDKQVYLVSFSRFVCLWVAGGGGTPKSVL